MMGNLKMGFKIRLLWIEGEPEFLEFALACGLGSRSSAGFGMVDVVV